MGGRNSKETLLPLWNRPSDSQDGQQSQGYMSQQMGNISDSVLLPPSVSGASRYDVSGASTYDVSGPSTYDVQRCPICFSNPRDMAFGCGHQTCEECSRNIQTCPICRSPIQIRIKVYL
ncbi:hypothetical protein SLEP1_g45229 [Rubroshorea leprosula]|uniref:RING-type domain-containing protein n=1 Tax=Rubroshorea leprosula TaxID=152421 RepID=A0AAV5LJ60_9ROSI|nr:hypothetical protein SLEP1_g45229 [Rubroshorea leprosula]